MSTATGRGLSVAALIAGLASIVLLVIYMVAIAPDVLLWIALALGAIAVIVGIVALVKRQSRTLAWIGLIAGALTILYYVATFLFALIFVGALLAY